MGAQYWLYSACESGDRDKLRRLLVDGADPNHRDVIVVAAQHGHRECVRLLLHYGANPNPVVGGGTALSYAVDTGDRAIVDMLLHGGAGTNVCCNQPPLVRAVVRADREIIRMLLNAGANVHMPTTSRRMPVIHLAIRNNDAVSLQMLVTSCARYPITDHCRGNCLNEAEGIRGDMPLHTAVRAGGKRRIIETLLWFGADPHLRNWEGTTPEDLCHDLRRTSRILAIWADGPRGLRRILAADANRRVVPSLAQLCAVTAARARVRWRLPTIPHALRAVISQTTGWEADGDWDSVQ